MFTMHQLALPWGTRDLISPELAGKDVVILVLVLIAISNWLKIWSTVHMCFYKIQCKILFAPRRGWHMLAMLEACMLTYM